MDGILVFSNPQYGQIRIAGTQDDPLFCLADICTVLGITNSRNVRARLDQGGVYLMDTPTMNQYGVEVIQEMVYVNEKNLYKVIMRSDKPQAEPFQDWVCGEVLPSIRRNGAYMTDATIESIIANPENGIKLLTALKDERMMRRLAEDKAAYLEKLYKEQQPKAAIADAVQIDELARILRQHGVDTGKHRLYRWMRDNGYLGTQGQGRNLPGQQYIDEGLFILNTTTYPLNGEMCSRTAALVTVKGIQFFIDKFIEITKTR